MQLKNPSRPKSTVKTPVLLLLAISTSSCATLGSAQGPQAVGAAPVADDAPDSVSAPIDSSFPAQNIGPRLIIPVTGGAPVMGIPLGGNMFLPVTGGAPVTGIDTSP